MKVYVLTQGCYSDYHICGVTLDKEKAELYAKEMSGNGMYHDEIEIEEYETDDLSSFETGMKLWCIYFTERKHEVIKLYIDTYVESLEPYFSKCAKKWIVRTYAIDEEHAIKSASDRLAKYLAEQAGL